MYVFISQSLVFLSLKIHHDQTDSIQFVVQLFESDAGTPPNICLGVSSHLLVPKDMAPPRELLDKVINAHSPRQRFIS